MTLHVIVTICHTSVMVTQSHVMKKDSRRFWKNDIIQHVIYMLTLKQICGHLE